ncbi:hypothetical protein FN846DRAFT_915304 [Sphaerosporella brunnea]|uniref:Uncharacterized protein n=1 Tax=Sphaerosporella brunnea TaxID=1250544 RepID=A0A5J5EBI0_9PEZI|nr:hypothetical protein FN846DRAFT_915304 [Sphaerosporella brunnea]
MSRDHTRDTYTARKIVQWSNSWIEDRSIPEGSAGKHRHTFSWLDDEGVLITARDIARHAGEQLNSYKLAEHIGAYLAKNRYFRRPDVKGESNEEELARTQ